MSGKWRKFLETKRICAEVRYLSTCFSVFLSRNPLQVMKKNGIVRENPRLCKVSHARFEDRLAFVAGDVFGDLGAGAFGVAHLAEDAAAGGGDGFDGS
jgi:hypothetical protein